MRQEWALQNDPRREEAYDGESTSARSGGRHNERGCVLGSRSDTKTLRSLWDPMFTPLYLLGQFCKRCMGETSHERVCGPPVVTYSYTGGPVPINVGRKSTHGRRALSKGVFHRETSSSRKQWHYQVRGGLEAAGASPALAVCCSGNSRVRLSDEMRRSRRQRSNRGLSPLELKVR